MRRSIMSSIPILWKYRLLFPLCCLWAAAYFFISSQRHLIRSDHLYASQFAPNLAYEYYDHQAPILTKTTTKTTTPVKKRILIVGAGAAGLTAAKRFVTSSLVQEQQQHEQLFDFDVQLLEASSGFGGRIQQYDKSKAKEAKNAANAGNKDEAGFTDIEYPIDLGASWVYDPKRLGLIARYDKHRDVKQRRALKNKTISPIDAVELEVEGDDGRREFQTYKIDSSGEHKPKSNLHTDGDHLWVNYSWYEFFKEHMVQPSLDTGKLQIRYNCKVTNIIDKAAAAAQGGKKFFKTNPTKGKSTTDNNKMIVVQSTCGEFVADHVIVTVSWAILLESMKSTTTTTTTIGKKMATTMKAGIAARATASKNNNNDDESSSGGGGNGGGIRFTPKLPLSLYKHRGKIKMWQGFKIFLEFSHKFYYDNFYWKPHDGEIDFWDYGLVQGHAHRRRQRHPKQQRRHILAGYYIGEPYTSKFRKDMTDEEIVQIVLKDLDKTFEGVGGQGGSGGRENNKDGGGGVATKSLLNYLVIHWSNNPNVRGIYTNYAIQGQNKGRGGPFQVWGGGDHREGSGSAAAANNNRLLLAGEAFPVPPEHNGWVDGAALSGLHAAELILQQIDDDNNSINKNNNNPSSNLKKKRKRHFTIPIDLWEEEED